MIFFIPHQTEQLSLANAQKEIVAEMNKLSVQNEYRELNGKNHSCYFPEFPLWINFNSQKQNMEKIFDSNFFKNKNEKLKSMRKNLNPIFIYKFQQKNGELFFPAMWNYGAEKFCGKIVFGKMKTENEKLSEDNSHDFQLSSFNFPFSIMTCKIFQVVQAEFNVSENGVKSWQVTESVWIKTQ